MDGTLSPVSMKGGIELLDNDTGTARRKVCSINKIPIEVNI